MAMLGAVAFSLGLDGRDAMADRLDSGGRLRVMDHVRTSKWWVAVLGASGFALAALTAKWWAGPRHPAGLCARMTITSASRRWWAVAVAILILAAVPRVERLGLGLYNDEAYMFRKYVAGEYREDTKTGETIFREPQWSTTLWHMEVGNNSPPYSALSRLAYEWVAERRSLADAEVHEMAIRLPALVAGLAGVLLAGVLARWLGAPGMGLVVMGVGALHPWLIRYGSEARGHSLLLPLMPLVLCCVLKALTAGSWRWWLALGGVSALMMWAFPGAIFWLIMVNGVVAWRLGRAWWREPDRRGTVKDQAARWLGANTLAGLVFWLLFAPMFSQMRVHLGEVPSLAGGPESHWLLDFSAMAGVGMPWMEQNPESPISLSIMRAGESGNPLPWLMVIAFALAAVIGGVRAWKRSRLLGEMLVAGALGAPLLAFGVARGTDTVLHLWYALSAAPLLVILIVMAFSDARDGRRRLIPRVGGGIVGLLWLVAVAPQIGVITGHSVQPMREAVELIRGGVYPDYLERARQVRHASFWTDVTRYDPFVSLTWSVPALREVEREARMEGLPLFVVFAHREIARGTHPELVSYLEDSGAYRHVTDLHSTDQRQFNHHVYEWLGADTAPTEPAGVDVSRLE